MRLIELRLKNLNSLKGEWHIDFSDKAFVNEGIFAITGQTGAGKTTILDAICLALYGETPRINSISKSSNEVMTRQTAECFAEVVIELNGVQYRCRWGQRRAYGKIDGNLQDATHELSRVNLEDPDKGDEILEEKLSRTKQKIIELTSMDFQQFTRSILLAQGSFSAFLKAKADERADILEKITGTQIYADISKNVYEKYRTQKEELDRLQAVSDSLSLLDEETETTYRKNIDTLNTDLSSKKTKQDNLESQIKWLQDVADLKHKLSQYTQEVDDAEQAKLGFKSDAERLDMANKALEISNDYNKLLSIRRQLTEYTTNKEDSAKQLLEVETKFEQSQQDLKTAELAEHKAVSEYDKAQPLIRETRQLDGQILQHQERLHDQHRRRDSLNANMAKLNESLTFSKDEQTQLQEKLVKTKQYLATRSHHEALPNDIESLHQLGRQLKTVLHNIAHKDAQRQEAKASLGQLTDKLSKLESGQNQVSDDIKRNKQQLATLKQRQHNLMQGQTLQSLRHQHNEIEQSSQQLNDIKAHFEQLGQLALQAKETQSLLPDRQQNINEIQQNLATNEDKLNRLNTELEDKKANLELSQQVAKLEDFIHLLQDDEPCPLCGSLEHPYDGNHPLLNNKSQPDQNTPTPIELLKNRVNELSSEYKNVESLISEDKIKLATSKHELVNYQKQFDEQLSKLAELISRNESLITTFTQNTPNLSPTLIDIINKQSLSKKLKSSIAEFGSSLKKLKGNHPESDSIENNQIDSGNLQQVITTADDLSSLIQNTRQDLVSQKQTLNTLLDENDKLTHEINQSEISIKALQDNSQSTMQQINALNTDIKLIEQQIKNDKDYIESNYAEIDESITLIRKLVTPYKQDGNDKWSTLDTALTKLSNAINNKHVLNESDCESYLETLRDHCRWMRQLQQDYNRQKELSQSLSSEIGNFETRINGLTNQLDDVQKELNDLNVVINDVKVSLDTLQKKRQTLYQDKDMDAEDKRLQQAVNSAKENLSQVRERYNHYQLQFKQLNEYIDKLNTAISKANDDLSKQQVLFDTLLKDNQFNNEYSYKEAMLERETREALATQKQNIDNNLQIALYRLAETKQQLENKLATPLVNLNNENDSNVNINTDIDSATAINQADFDTHTISLTNQLTTLKSEISELDRQIGALQQQLKTNEKNKIALEEQLEKIKKQQHTYNIWNNLRELIGSADGKKFRTFAQGLTFQIMVSNANIQLEKMSDRYLLTRDEGSPLELNVIDNYQGGEVRSTKNLSGGEGFIISLALALGLSNMASQNMSVDSLFLDEGFGTLDEDSLDIALDTLTNLQSEGKLIGVISHVQSLKERILTQIKVEKVSGGHSQLSGPGCRQL
ncbi:AAA family ATPase [Psychrobacter sanguinis]|uniref:AAA family ATPase n=1 Tax=Psychrobacter sanguinis TaxID=861445 RepID=UPI00020C9346|nr:AAA family ATPase [Psychrobacter sanguinis]EGK15312.1 SMC domain protein [Psychrobacter sp. 1501(2011)]MCD9151405.1 AAA family ATPase [Psychrobacter sanguinis]